MEVNMFSSSNVDVPYERIFGKFNGEQLCQMSVVCKAWKQAASNQHIWHNSFVQHWCPKVENDVCKYDKNTDYKKLYSRWATGDPSQVTLFEDQKHNGTVRGVELVQNQYYSAAEDGSLHIVDIQTEKLVKCILNDQYHGKSIGFQSMLLSSGGLVLTGCIDGCIKAWDERQPQEMQPVMKITDSHYDEVFALAQTQNNQDIFYSGGGDHEIRAWDLRYPSAGPIQEYSGHDGSVYSIAIDSHRGVLYSGGGDGKINRFDIQDGTWLSILEGHRGDVVGLSLGEERLVSGGDDGSIREWELHHNQNSPEEQVSVATLGMRHVVGTQGSQITTKTSVTCLSALGVQPSGVLVGTWLGQIAVSQRSGQLKAMGKGRERAQGNDQYVPVTCLHAQHTRILTGFDDGIVRLTNIA